QTTASDYVVGIVRLAIAVAAVLAVVRIIFAGIKYMSTEAFQSKGEAKTDIQNAVWGLLLAIGAYLILNTINPNLVEFKLTIPGLKTGGALETNLGKIPSTPEETTRQKEGIGCEESCAPVQTPYSGIGTMEPKPPGPYGNGASGCDSAKVSVCFLDASLYQKLKTLTQSLPKSIEWQVTELYPPTTEHKHACQNIGTPVRAMCVDAKLDKLQCANQKKCSASDISMDASKILVFVEESDKFGLYVEYEVNSTERRDQIINRISKLRGRVIVVPTINSEHFSVYLNKEVKDYGKGDND
ncbi:MAG: hypothetical protein AAB690_00430, partial [Patescibacteria group bacterium]